MTPDEIKAWREEHELTRPALAALLGVAPGTVRNWEQGVRHMPTPTEMVLQRLTRTEIARGRKVHPPKRRRRAAPPLEG